MIETINMTETRRKPKKRLSNEEIYHDIRYCVEQQVSEMLSQYYYDWNNRNKYVKNIYISNFSWGILLCLNEKNPDEFIQQAERVFGPFIEEEQLLREAFPRYVKIWEENWEKMVTDAGMTMEVYQQKQLEFFHQLLAKNRRLSL